MNLTLATWDHDRCMPLHDGRVTVPGVTFKSHILPTGKLFPIAVQEARFDVTELSKAYDGQYLLIDARPGEPSDELLPGEDDMARLRQLVDDFETGLAKVMRDWRTVFAETRARGERAVLWGSTSRASGTRSP